MPTTEGWNTLKYDFFDFGFTIKAHQWTTIWRFLLTNSMPQCSDIFFRFAYRKDKLRKNIIYAKNYVRILFCRPPYGEDNDRGFSQLVEYTGGSRHLFSLPGLYFVFCILYFVFGRVNRRVKTSISSARFVFNPFRKENMKTKRRF